MTPVGPASPAPTTLPLRSTDDVVLARREVRELSAGAGFDLVSQTKLVTAVSELARNAVVHGGGGRVTIQVVRRDADVPVRTGVLVDIDDDGPGIADMDRAMTGGWSSGTGLGLGLPGSRRLVHEFEITSSSEHGTHVAIAVWRRGG